MNKAIDYNKRKADFDTNDIKYEPITINLTFVHEGEDHRSKLAKGFKAKKLKKKSMKIKLKVKSDGKVKGFKVKGKKAKKWIKVSKKGVVTLMKGIKKGTYKIRVQIKGTKNFKKGYQTIKIVVK